MREISLDDPDIKSITTYDTSGLYTDSNYNHSYENGLKSIREEWLKNREGLFQDKKLKLKYLTPSKTVEKFPRIPEKIFKKEKSQAQISQLFLQETILLLKKWNTVP